ncbi:MAG TPA: anhydro-N-acetylmuramic acid kinase [Gemmatimonadaceae bacterium]|nr:anhydro-N-acetylmuramic acid kinase [Gemmatimonadaceae bacterium]
MIDASPSQAAVSPRKLETRVLVGLMSGTSLDGITAAVVRFSDDDNGRLKTDLLALTARDYTPEERARLQRALSGTTPSEYCRLNFELGGWLADAAVGAIAEAGVSRADIAAIASHGQSVWHEPGHSTWQTGESSVIAERTGIDVISDFRVRDMAAGGQGAPLVPMADAMLFSDASEWRALQNLGGIGNVSVVPPGGDLRGVRAFDTGPGCGVIDKVVRSLRPDLPYDRDGSLALRGTSIGSVVDRLLAHEYFRASPPKSTGPELFGVPYAEALIASCRREKPAATDEDIIASAVALTAKSIGDAYERFIAEPITEVFLSGGGARNPALVRAITAAVAPRKVTDFDATFFDGDAKEAVAFALLGYLHLSGWPGNVPTATGARGPRILGKRTPA